MTAPHAGKMAYPLTCNLLRECFDIATLPAGRSVEDLFQEAIDRGDHEPMRRLDRILQKADYFLSDDAQSPYRAFLQAFPAAPILTFNYDGLVEILALHMGQWRPEDGFGVKVEVHVTSDGTSPAVLPVQSSRQVLHLHGSLYLHAQELEIVPHGLGTTDLLRIRNEPRFIFDPDSVTDRFHPFSDEPVPEEEGIVLQGHPLEHLDRFADGHVIAVALRPAEHAGEGLALLAISPRAP